MKTFGLLLFALMPSPAFLFAKSYSRTFKQPIDRVFEASVAVAKERYTIEAVDRTEHILTFHTGMGLITRGMEVTVTMEELHGQTRVTCRPAKRGSQLFAWGEGERIIKKFWRQLDEQLAGKRSQTAGGFRAPPTRPK